MFKRLILSLLLLPAIAFADRESFQTFYIASGATALGNVTFSSGNLIFTSTNNGILDGVTSYPADVASAMGTAVTLLSAKNNSADAGNMALMSIGAVTNAAEFAIMKSRATDGSADTIVGSTDNIGVITFFGADGTLFRRAASIRVDIDGTPGASDMPGRLVFSVTADGASSATEAMRISNDKSISIQDKFTSARTTDLGWTRVNGANTACNTTCTSACVFGWDTADPGALLACTDATADSCLCAGAS